MTPGVGRSFLRARTARVDAPTPPPISEIVRKHTGSDHHTRPHLDYLTNLLEAAVTHWLDGCPGGDTCDAPLDDHGRHQRLVISMPTGMGKSVTTSVALPVHILARAPRKDIVIASAEQSLADKFSRDVRENARRHGVLLGRDVSQVREWRTTAGGTVLARGVSGTTNGRRVDALLMDDLIKDQNAAMSERAREKLWDWWQTVGSNRLDVGSSFAALVQTRWHEADLAATLLERGWQDVRLPAIAEEGDLLGRAPGDPLYSPQKDETREEALERWKALELDKGSYVWAGMYQQRPAPPGGLIFNPDDLRPADTLPAPEAGVWVTSWDLSFKATATSDYTVGTVWQKTGDGPSALYVLHGIYRDRWAYSEQRAQIRAAAEKWRQCTRHLIEEAANGSAVLDELKRENIPGVEAVKPLGSKEARHMDVSPLLEAGRVVYAPGVDVTALVKEMEVAPNGVHDDALDSMAQALRWLRGLDAKLIRAHVPGRQTRNGRQLSATAQKYLGRGGGGGGRGGGASAYNRRMGG